MESRRGFIGALGAAGLLGAAGCRGALAAREARRFAPAVSPNYWCTWGIQNEMLGKVERSPLAFAGDQGAAGARNNINEDAVFGKGGWTGLFPKSRERLWMMLDDGWDVPYGTLSSVSTEAFALMDPHPARFPSLGATRRERLANLNRRLVEAGWRGAVFWFFLLIIITLCVVLFFKQMRIWLYEHTQRVEIMCLFGAPFWFRSFMLYKIVFVDCLIAFLLLLVFFTQIFSLNFVQNSLNSAGISLPDMNFILHLIIIFAITLILSLLCVNSVMFKVKR